MRRTHTAAILALGLCLSAGVRADVYYEVGSGQTYATIQAALIATPWNFSSQPQPVFTESHIINIHAGTYARFETDFNSRLNGQVSRTSVTNRLIIQANPGDIVVINDASYSHIRESHVTVQGIKFTGKSADPNFYYILIGTGGFGTPNQQRGGVIVQNCEFDGGRGLKGLQHASYNGEEPGVYFNFAFINNYVHDFDSHYEVPGSSTQKQFRGGNLYVDWGTLGGSSLMRPAGGTGHQERWYINNTFYTTNTTLTGVLRGDSGLGAFTNVYFANNLIVKTVAGGAGYWYYINTNFPVMVNTMQYGSHSWAYDNLGPGQYMTLPTWTNWLASIGAQEINPIWSDPLFVDEPARDFRISDTSPAYQAADQSYWTNALAAMGIENLLGYWNAERDPGFQRGNGTTPNVGAMVNPPPPPPEGTTVIVR